MGNMMCNSEAICRASKEDLMETEVTNKRKKDKQEQEKLDKLTKLQSYVMTYLSGDVSSLKAPEWKKIITYVLPAANAGTATKITKLKDIKARLNMLDKPWHSYIPMEGDTVTAQIVDTAVVLPGDDLAPADECIDNLTDDRCRDAAEMDAANAMMALV